MASDRKFIVFNWKSVGSRDLASEFQTLSFPTGHSFIVCPPFSLLGSLNFPQKNVFLGAQNCMSKTEKPVTGEVTSATIREFGAEFVILGHVERRTQLKEEEFLIGGKAEAALEAGLTPIICTREVYQDSGYLKSVTSSLLSREAANQKNFLVAFEPMCAIGTGSTPPIDIIEREMLRIRDLLRSYANSGASVSVLYGGSVNSKNILSILDVCDGVLIGSASTNIEEMERILRALA